MAPFAAQTIYQLVRNPASKIDMVNLLIILLQLLRAFHSLVWISWARFQTASSKHRIIHRSLEFEQVDRERNWYSILLSLAISGNFPFNFYFNFCRDDQLLLTAMVLYLGNFMFSGASNLPWWDSKEAIIIALMHAGPVEFLYYWFHRALHHHFLYSLYHSHHHASIVT